MTERIAFRMTLNHGQAAEYERRHDAIFPDLVVALKDAGISDYSIWLDPVSNHLFGILTRTSLMRNAGLMADRIPVSAAPPPANGPGGCP